ncbi:MAG: hypothetical protein KGL35_01815 [Bradyrhizobium sp.]|nr:hypothetical protein [Bradyrhizobium sp.]
MTILPIKPTAGKQQVRPLIGADLDSTLRWVEALKPHHKVNVSTVQRLAATVRKLQMLRSAA